MADVDLVAVTDSPGLAGALLVGVSFALGIHCGWGVPVVGVNHLEGHIVSATIENPGLTFPFLALVVSGGHTALYRVEDFGAYNCLGQTVDDAAGEAFDKVGKLLGFGYPAGRAIEMEARGFDGTDAIRFPVARLSGTGMDFSFSGLKTAVKYHIREHGASYAALNRPRICHSFQKAVIESLASTTGTALRKTGLKRVALVGGVACNQALRDALRTELGDMLYFPSPPLCTDNAAMIAKAGCEHFRRGIVRFPRMQPSPVLRAALAAPPPLRALA